MTRVFTNLLRIGLAGAASATLGAGYASAQPFGVDPRPPSYRAGEAAAACCVIPAGTEVAVELDRAIGTDSVKAGEAFDIHLAAPLIVQGQVILPAGTPG